MDPDGEGSIPSVQTNRKKLMTNQEQDLLIIKAIRWTAKSAASIQNAGGAVETLLDKFPDDLLVTMLRNSLEITHNRKIN